jgi:glycosyltransferase involved in cell wall biosynthesis
MISKDTPSEGPLAQAPLAKETDEHRRAILILGMHRSGTSAAAGLCQCLGWEVPGDLIPAAVDNPKGFFENATLVAYNDQLLEMVGSRYDEPVGITTQQLQLGRDLGAVPDLTRLLSHELGRAPIVVVKDPRICRLAPLWIDALESAGRQVSTLQPLRHPLEVADSLSKRNGFPQAQGLLLWLHHVLAAERASRGRPRSFVLYDELLGDWRTAAAKISEDLRLLWRRSIALAEADIDGFISGDLRHHQARNPNLLTGNVLDVLAARSWNALCQLAGDPDDVEASANLDAVFASLTAAEAIYGGYVSASQKQLFERLDRIGELERHAAHMEHVLERANAEHESITSEASLLAKTLEAARAETSSAVTMLSDAQQRQSTTEMELAGVRDSLRDKGGGRRVVGRSPRVRLKRQAGRIVRAVLRRLITPNSRPLRVAPTLPRQNTLSTVSLSDPRVYATDDQRSAAQLISSSAFFDAAFYEGCDVAASPLENALHYVLVGEKQDLRPSARFDPRFYREKYADVAGAVPNYLVHFIQNGQMEGRTGIPAAANMPFQGGDLKPGRRTVLILAHEASRTGAPILAWNLAKGFRRAHNVIVLLMRGGEFLPAFRSEADVLVGPVGDPACFDPAESRFAVRELLKRYDVDFCIANSVETRSYAAELSRCSIPVIALVHEFSTYYRPPGLLHELYETASKIVFPAELVRDSSCAEYEALRRRQSEILPQGPSAVPPLEGKQETGSDINSANDLRKRNDLVARLRPRGAESAFLVLGMGTVQQRKGVDLFIAAAAAARRAAPERSFRFVWLGHGYKPDQDLQYSVYLQAQIERSGLEGSLEIMDAVDDLEPVYSEMDALMLSSRLDPLPNVSIDAALRGIPVVCFAGASGMAEILTTHPALKKLIAPHLDSTSAGQILAGLATNKAQLAEVKKSIRELANSSFDMEHYVAELSRLGEEAAAEMRQFEADRKFILSHATAFDRQFYTGDVLSHLSLEEAISHYLTQMRHRSGKASQPHAYLRRPTPGFNPLRFLEENSGSGESAQVDPLLAYVASDRPAGPWAHRVIRPADDRTRSSQRRLRAAIHGHFHYPELLTDFIRRLEANQSAFDLILTTDGQEKASCLRQTATQFTRGEVTVQSMPNAGRDIGPFLTGLRKEIATSYDVIGHLHGKRSVHTQAADETYGDRWREFLWEHLVGARFPMVDIILSRFEESAALGLVFPEDPNLVGWDRSEKVALSLAKRLNIRQPLPASFDFPNGTMFWGRTAALKPLFDLNLDWSDYPTEPLPKDGTVLHALERLIPFAIEVSGYDFETTQVPGVFR